MKICAESLFKKTLAVLLCTAISAFAVTASGGMADYGGDVISADADYNASEAVSVPALSAKSAILVDAESGRVLLEQNGYSRLPMASTTKIMTALTALENMDCGTEITVSDAAVGIEGSSIYLYAGEKLTLEQLLYAILLESANDAAAAVAIAVGGSIEGFAELMNQTADKIGLENSNFENPHGLDSENHYTTAYDLARLTAYALQNETFRKIVSTYRAEIPQGEGGARLLINHNKLLKNYEGAIGVKTGFTKKSGRCLVSAAERGGVCLIAVTLSAPNDFDDHAKMLDYGFSRLEHITLADIGEISSLLPVINGTVSEITVKNHDSLALTLEKYGMTGAVCAVELPRFVFAPVCVGDVLGRAVFYNQNGDILGSVDLIAEESSENIAYKKGIWSKITDFLGFN